MTSPHPLDTLMAAARDPDPAAMRTGSEGDCHYPGLFSLVLTGVEVGERVRVYHALEGVPQGAIALHSHGYDLTLVGLRGAVTEVVATRPEAPLECNVWGKSRQYARGRCSLPGAMWAGRLSAVPLLPALWRDADANGVHTVIAEPGAMWAVIERGAKVHARRRVVGPPIVTDGLYRRPYDFEIEARLADVRAAVDRVCA